MAEIPGLTQVLSDADLHVLRRFTWGYNKRLEADVLRYANINAWFEAQLAGVPDPTGAPVIGWFPHLRDSPAKAWANNVANPSVHSGWEYGEDLIKYSLARRVLSQNQVHEVMVDFWSNLLHVPVGEDISFPWRFDYDQKAIRANALTSYVKLLQAAVTHPSMSGFLTNYRNTGLKINENLGRELLELYTVGRTSGYTETDVQNSAKMLTGFWVDVFDTFAAKYLSSNHYVGALTILGRTFPNSSADGRAELNRYLEFLALHESTATKIATRLCRRFVADEPPAGVIAAVKATYLATKSDIKACLRTLMKHPDFVASVGQKARTPIEDMVAMTRALDIEPTGHADDSYLGSLSWYCSSAGQRLMSWPRPDGFPETSSTYLSPARILRTWTYHGWASYVEKAPAKARIPVPRRLLPRTWPATFTDLVNLQSLMMTGRPASTTTIEAAAIRLDWDAGRVITKPSTVSTWVLQVIRSTILNSPESMVR